MVILLLQPFARGKALKCMSYEGRPVEKDMDILIRIMGQPSFVQVQPPLIWNA